MQNNIKILACMFIILNNRPKKYHEVSMTLGDLIEKESKKPEIFIVRHNGVIINQIDYDKIFLEEGDIVDITDLRTV